MNTKLTLSLNPAVIADAKQYAKAQGKSLSSIVEEYLKSLAQENPSREPSSLEILQALRGSVKVPKDFISYKDSLKDVLIEKYLGE